MTPSLKERESGVANRIEWALMRGANAHSVDKHRLTGKERGNYANVVMQGSRNATRSQPLNAECVILFVMVFIIEERAAVMLPF